MGKVRQKNPAFGKDLDTNSGVFAMISVMTNYEKCNLVEKHLLAAVVSKTVRLLKENPGCGITVGVERTKATSTAKPTEANT